jgi:GNAT superfamily N-acetyltransferase
LRSEVTPVLLTTELDEAIRRCEIAGIRNAVTTTARLRPDLGAEAIEVCGGLVAFTGAKVPLSQAFGLGMSEPVRREDVEQIVEFYESRGASPRVFVTPFSHSTLGRELAAAGFAPCEYDNVMASDDFGDRMQRDPRVIAATDLQGWALASVEAFMHPEAPQTGDELVACIIASSPGVLALEVRDGDAIVATAAMDLQEGCAGLFAGSVAPAFRGRGFHIALIHDRIARAREAGASFMRATAQPASASERNFRRCGFTTLYTRALWERKAADSGEA